MELAVSFRFNDGTEVRRFGYGAMRLTGQPGNFGPYGAWDEGKKVLLQALELGINFIDTARAYEPGWNERLIADALYPYPEGLFIATKGGVVKKSATERYLDGSPDGLRRDCEESLKNLRVECIDLYQLHWVDPAVPLSESVRGLARLQEEGKIRLIGLSNITVEQVEEARSIAQIASVQNRYSVGERQGDPMVDCCAREGIAFIPYGPLGADPMKQGTPLAWAEGAFQCRQIPWSDCDPSGLELAAPPGSKYSFDSRDNFDRAPDGKCGGVEIESTQKQLQELQAWPGL